MLTSFIFAKQKKKLHQKVKKLCKYWEVAQKKERVEMG